MADEEVPEVAPTYEPTTDAAPDEPTVTQADILDAPAGDMAETPYSAANPPPAITSPIGPVVEESPTATPDEPQELGADGVPVSALDAGAEQREKMRRGEYDYSVGDPAQG